jgi:PAS domain S-box-containing protein
MVIWTNKSQQRKASMQRQPTDPATEVKRLQRCVNNLVSVLALPAVWNGSELSRILDTFLDALLLMLDLDFIYARVRLDSHEAPIDALKAAPFWGTSNSREELRHALNQWPGGIPQWEPEQVLRHLGEHEVSVFPIRMGIEGELGLIVAGSHGPGFPEQTENLILSVAANQLAIGLQQAILLSEQKRVATELERRVMERTRELAESNEELQLQVGLLQHLPVSAWTLKPDGTPDFVNKVWLEFSGQTLDFVRSHPEAWMTAVHPEDREAASRAFWKGVHSGQDFTFETRSLRAQDGIYRWHLQQAVVLRDAEGRVLKFAGTTTDIDDQKRAEEELRNSQAELARMTRVMTIGQLTASIAHEVSQPLSGIIMNASTALRMLETDPPNIYGARETVQRTIRDGNRAIEVISRLRTLFSKKQIDVESLDLNETVREVIALISDELQRNNVILKHEFSDHLPLVKGDRVQLQQVILNLLRNGTEAMGTVHGRPRRLLVQTENDGNHVTVSVRDSGIGFSPEISMRLFEPFFTTKQEGMGIGLSVSRSIVEAHNGRMWAVRNDGPGATFAFSIPHDSENLHDQSE